MNINELIEKCGKHIFLYQRDDGWDAYWSKSDHGIDPIINSVHSFGVTIEEALEKLLPLIEPIRDKPTVHDMLHGYTDKKTD